MIPLIILLAFLLAGCEKLESVFIEEDLLQRPQAKRCMDCHADIYEEWKESRHYHAWTSEQFKIESENYSKLKCLPCHAPHQVDPDKKPVLRAEFKADGVSCVACHFKEETKSMHGPLKVWSPPHPSKKDLAYVRSNFCAGCHQETFKEWRRSGTIKTCQSCHMPDLGKKDLIQKFPYYLFHLSKPRSSHRFPSLKAKPEDLRFELKDNVLYITNYRIPHNLPTADQGDPRLYIIARVYYRNGKVRTVRKLLSAQSKQVLAFREPFPLKLPKGEIEEVRVRVLRKLAWKKEKDLIGEFRIPSPSHARGGQSTQGGGPQ